LGDLQAEAARAAGDERGLALEVEQLADVGAHGALRDEVRRGGSGRAVADARAQPEDDDAGGDDERAGDRDGPAVARAVAHEGDAEGDDDEAAEDERPDEDVEVGGGELQNDSSGIVRQVSSREATTPSQAPSLGSS